MSSDESYKFMVNILSESRHKTRYVKALENITIDAQVSYQRLAISTLIAIGLLLTFFGMMRYGPSGQFRYIFIQTLIFFIASLILLVVYLVSSRDRSMLQSVFDLLLFKNVERMRLNSSKNAKLTSVGIKEVKNGVIYFIDGGVGLMYDIEGQMSYSVLPAVASAVSKVRHQYFISRSETCEEYLFTSIRKTDTKSKIEALNEINENYVNNPDLNSQWIAHMARVHENYINSNMASEETQIFQHLILREIDIQSLKKSRQKFESQAANGMYAAVTPVVDKHEIAERLESLTLLSKESLRKYQIEDQEKQEEKSKSIASS